ncbi:MAG: hypothetical protein L6Q71_11805, partial [Planctomycetes bacterium]|nr:hypothetical protein [Planctomycetota bacterium]
KSFVELQRTLTFSNDEEGRASRDILSRAQTRQAELPDATLKLAERFSNVAQAYAFNDVEADDIEKKQENTIQVVRIILMLLSADTDLGNTIANNMSAARTHAEELARQAAINSLLAELGLLDGLTGVRSSFDRNAFAGILASSTYRDPATLSRLDLLYKSIMRPEATSDTRRRDLEAVIEAQSQTLAGFKIVLDRVGRWETFAAIREEAQRVADMLDQAIKEMKESQKGR